MLYQNEKMQLIGQSIKSVQCSKWLMIFLFHISANQNLCCLVIAIFGAALERMKNVFFFCNFFLTKMKWRCGFWLEDWMKCNFKSDLLIDAMWRKQSNNEKSDYVLHVFYEIKHK
jgi:hypothetical protein